MGGGISDTFQLSSIDLLFGVRFQLLSEHLLARRAVFFPCLLIVDIGLLSTTLHWRVVLVLLCVCASSFSGSRMHSGYTD